MFLRYQWRCVFIISCVCVRCACLHFTFWGAYRSWSRVKNVLFCLLCCKDYTINSCHLESGTSVPWWGCGYSLKCTSHGQAYMWIPQCIIVVGFHFRTLMSTFTKNLFQLIIIFSSQHIGLVLDPTLLTHLTRVSVYKVNSMLSCSSNTASGKCLFQTPLPTVPKKCY